MKQSLIKMAATGHRFEDAEVDSLKELEQFLTPETRKDIRIQAISQVLGLTGTPGGQRLFVSCPSLLKCTVQLLFDQSPAVANNAHLALVNLTNNDEVVGAILKMDVVKRLVDALVNPDFVFADQVCASLSNLTRTAAGSKAVLTCLVDCDENRLSKLVNICCVVDYNSKAKLHYVATILSNITQLRDARALLLDGKHLLRLMPLVHFENSVIRRGGIVGLLRNLCFETERHSWLLSEEVDLLPVLLLPLAGPEEFEDQDTEKFPLDLQYLPDDKTREEDPSIRKMLVEALMQLCATKVGRKILREKGTYLLMREYHKWEKDDSTTQACEKLIGMLIADEPEPGMEDLSKVTIPEEVTKQFEQYDLKKATENESS